MNPRATPGSLVTSLGSDAYRLMAYRQSGAGIVQGTGADWFGPLNPMAPVAPPEVAGRALDYPSGYNLEISPRPYEPIKFQDLRNLADSYDILRLCIETRKDQMERLQWVIKPKEEGDEDEPESDSRVKKLTEFFASPDKENSWGSWLRMLLEDMFVIDAASIYRQRTRGGELYALQIVDGSTIKRIITDWGRTPLYPVPAYQQVLKGFPAVNYTTKDLLYAPRNMRISKFYGYSPVEQIVMSVNIALRRQLFQLNYYTDGNMPEALVGTPDLWTPEQIQRLQGSFDAMLSGNLAARRRIKFIPGGVAKNFVPLKEPDLTGVMDEWLARMTCFAFSLPPTPFVKQMNRATAQTVHDAALEEGLAPLQFWVKGVIDRIIREDFGITDLEFGWADDRETDPKVQSDVLTSYAKAGVLKLNEVRDVLGQDPVDGGDTLMVLTATGYVPISVNEDMPTAGETADAQAKQTATQAEALANAQPQDGTSGGKGSGGKGKTPEKTFEADKLAKGSDEQPRDEGGRWTASDAKKELLNAQNVHPSRSQVAKESEYGKQVMISNYEAAAARVEGKAKTASGDAKRMYQQAAEIHRSAAAAYKGGTTEKVVMTFRKGAIRKASVDHARNSGSSKRRAALIKAVQARVKRLGTTNDGPASS